MKKEEIQKLLAEGKYIFRVQFRPDRRYHLAYRTPKGGWAIFDYIYISQFKEQVERWMKELIAEHPDKYVSEEERS